MVLKKDTVSQHNLGSEMKHLKNENLVDALAQERILFQTLIDYLPDRIYVKDLQGKKIICNKADWKACGCSSMQEALGKSDSDLYEPELALKYFADDKRVMQSREPIINKEEPGLDAAGKPVWVLTTKIPLPDSLGNICGLIGIGREITQLKLAQTTMQEQTERLEIAAVMARASSSTLNLTKLMTLITGLIKSYFDFYHVGIHLIDADRQTISLRSAGGQAAEQLMSSSVPLPIIGNCPVTQVVQSCQSLLIPDTGAWPGFTPHLLLPDTCSEVLLPLLVGKKIIGVLDFQSSRPHEFRTDNLAFLQTLADQIAMAIQNAYLYKQAIIRTDQLQKLSQATDKIMGSLGKVGLDDLLNLIAKYSAELLEAEVSGILIVKREGFLSLEAGYGDREGEFKKGLELEIVSAPGSGLTGHIAHEEKLFNKYGEELKSHFAVRKNKQDHLPSHFCYSLLAIPLFKGSGKTRKLMGLLRVENKMKEGKGSPEAHFSVEDEWILSVFANTVVIAIESAQLVDQIQRTRRESQQIAKVSTIGDLDDTLESIVQGAKSALGSEIATIYTYDYKSGHFLKCMGTGCNPAHMVQPEKITEGSTLWKIIQGDKSYYTAEDVPNDEMFQGKFADQEKIQSTLAVRLKFVKKPMGILMINHRKYHEFTKDEVDVAQQYGRQAAIAIRNTQLYQETHRLFVLLQALNAAMTSTSPLEETLNLVVKQAVKISGIVGEPADYGYISLKEGNRLLYKNSWPKKGLTHLKQMIGDIDLKGEGKIGITGRAVLRGQAEIVGDVTKDPDYICIDEKIHSELVIPIKYKNDVIGVINLEHHLVNGFDNYDLYLLEKLAAQVAITIQTVNQYEQSEYDAQLREGLLKVGQAILTTQETEDVLKILVKKIREALQADIVTLYTYDPSKGRQVLKLDYDGDLLNPASAAQLQKISGHSIVRKILSKKTPVFADDTLHNLTINTGDFAHYEKIRSSAGIPLLFLDQSVGVLFVNYRAHHKFSKQQREDLQLFAAQAALAVKNAFHFEDLRKQEGLVGSYTALAFMGMANSVWGHNIEGHVINIRNIATLMRQDLKDAGIPEELKTRLFGRAELIESQVKEVLDKEMIPRLSKEHARISVLNDLIQERVRQLQLLPAYKGKKINLHLKEKIRVRVIPEWFTSALDILIDNGIKAMQTTPDPTISITAAVREGKVEISIADNGSGIPEKLTDLILKKQIVDETQKGGLGLGLLLAQSILKPFNGSLQMKETSPQGTTFMITLPVVNARN